VSAAVLAPAPGKTEAKYEISSDAPGSSAHFHMEMRTVLNCEGGERR
jgi:hypothetical protein